MMVLLSLLAVGLLSLSGVALRGGRQGEALAEARANARFALTLAIGALQEQLGPDQRISASASVLGSPESSDQDVANGRWVGVWDSWKGDNRYVSGRHKESDLVPDLSDHRKDSFRGWLVSGEDGVDLDELETAEASVSGDSVVLVGTGTLGSVASMGGEVRVPLVRTTDSDGRMPGAFGWWVGDESQKGSVGPGRTAEELDDPAQVIAETDAASSLGEEMFDPLSGPFDEEQLSRATVSRQTLGLLEGAEGVGGAFHDLTTNARSVLSDVREGGLKRDLSLLAEAFDADFTGSKGLPVAEEFMLYDFGEGQRVPLHDLLTYYSLYKSRPEGSRGSIVADGNSKPYTTNISHREWSANRDGLSTNLYRQPVLVKTQLAIWARSERSSANRNRPYRLKIRFTPIITLWNPYNVPLKLNQNAGDALRIDIKGISGDFAIWPRYERGNDRGRESSSLGGLTAGEGGAGNATENLASLAIRDRVEFAPGEVRVFSLNQRFGDLTEIRDMKAGYWPISGNEVDYYDVRASRGGAGGANYNSDSVTFAADQVIGVGFAGGTEDSGATFLKHSQGVAVEVMPNTDPETSWRTQALYSRRTAQYRPGGSVADEMNRFNQLVFELGSLLDGEEIPFRTGDGKYVRRPYSIRNLESPEGEMVGVFTYGVAGEHEVLSYSSGRQPRFPSRPFLNSLPTAASPWIQDVSTAALYNLGWAWRIEDGEESSNEIVVDGHQGRFGGGWSAAYGQSRVVQYELPQRPFFSLAQFSNAALGGWSISRRAPDDKSTGLNSHEVTTAAGQGGLFPAASMAIGNSYANQLIPSDRAISTWNTRKYHGGERTETFVDHSYLANHALWDEFFMSSIADQVRGLHAVPEFRGKRAAEMADDFFGGERAQLPNRRFVPAGELPWGEFRSKLFRGASGPTDEAYEAVAGYLLLEGGFNVNSTSVDAWASLLASLRGKPGVLIPGDSDAMRIVIEDHGGETPVPSFSIGTAESLSADSNLREDSFAPEQWVGSFTLTDDQVRTLAREIVRQVKLRGPFLSLSDFINRQLSEDPDLARWGALQAAIEEAGLNDALATHRSVNLGRPSEFLRQKKIRDPDPIPFEEAGVGPVVQGSAAYIDQADLLRGIDSQLVPRGDTFLIRTCGEALDGSGQTLARAYCEAVVQRLPGYLDGRDLPETRTSDLSSETNRVFGRRFSLVSFRWLTVDEI